VLATQIPKKPLFLKILTGHGAGKYRDDGKCRKKKRASKMEALEASADVPI
jgi:hypothetical protein